MSSRRDVLLVVGTQLAAAALLLGWVAVGGSYAPDQGLQQVDVLSLHEKVPGIEPADGKPTLLASGGQCQQQGQMAHARYGRPDGLPTTYGLTTLDAEQTRAVGLGRALTSCAPGYALIDARGYVRYRTYDPGFGGHADEQRVLLGAIR